MTLKQGWHIPPSKPTITVSVPSKLQKQAGRILNQPYLKAQYKDNFAGRVFCSPFRLTGNKVQIVDIVFN